MLLAYDRVDPERVRYAETLGDVWVLSRYPIPGVQNFPLKVDGPVPVRVGVTINEFLKTMDLSRYERLIKMDSDIVVPPGYFSDAPEGKVFGCGQVMVIPRAFFENELNGVYPVNLCDDGYIQALAISHDKMKCQPLERRYQLNEGGVDPDRRHGYGVEKYKWGFPPLLFFVQMRKGRIRENLYELGGWISALLNDEPRYSFSRDFGPRLLRMKALKILKILSLEPEREREIRGIDYG